MRQVTDKQTGNQLTVTDAWLTRNGHLVSDKPAKQKAARPDAPRKRATRATETADTVKQTSALPDTNE